MSIISPDLLPNNQRLWLENGFTETTSLFQVLLKLFCARQRHIIVMTEKAFKRKYRVITSNIRSMEYKSFAPVKAE